MTDAASIDLDVFLRQEAGRVKGALERALAALAGDIPAELTEPIRHSVMTGGKRLRPILSVVAYRACGGTAGLEMYDLSAALELVHAYSLMHDDLPCMDDAELRRGRPTPHTVFGEAATVRAGLALIPAASLHALRASRALGCDDDTARSVVRELNRAAGAGGMVGGQYLDLLAEGNTSTWDGLDALYRRKTGALLTASLVIGGLVAGAPESTLMGLRRYGRSIGLAFQIADDILDGTASAAELGKHPSDAQLEKSTYVTVHGVAESELRACALTEEAVEALRVGQIDSPELVALAHYVVGRKR